MKYTRRKFIKCATAATIGSVLVRNLPANGSAQFDNFVLPTANFGKTGLTPSLLGVGTGSNGFGGRSHQTELGRKELVSLLEYAADRSVTYFDLADQYGSHPFMKQALKSGGGTIDREKCFLLTKSHAKTAKEMRADLDRFRQDVGTDYFDVVLLHCEVSGNWTESHAGAMEALSEAKQEGIVGAHGVSCHSLTALETAARTPWVDVDLARFNPWGQRMDADVETVKGVLQTMKDQSKGIIGMKILSGGRNTSPEDVETGISHALNCGLLDCFTIGVKSRQELDQLLNYLSRLV